MSAAASVRTAGLPRRIASAIYDLLLTTALALVVTLPFIALFGDSTQGWRRHLLQIWVLTAVGSYYVWFWTRGGQTLAMKTWRIRLVRARDGAGVGTARAVHRYVLAVIGALALGLGFAYALLDRDRQFLHDRLAGTAIVDAAKP